MTKLAILAVLIAAYVAVGWVGVMAGLAGLAAPYIFVLGFMLRHRDEVEIRIER
jgi:hypothetical protein